MNTENYDPYFPDQPVVDLYLPVWANLPSFRFKPAFIWAEDDDKETGSISSSIITYQQLNNSAQTISSQLLLLPLQRNDAVLILCSPGLELVEVIFGCQRAGLLSVPIAPPDPSFSGNNYHHFIRVLSQTKPKAAIANLNYIKKVQDSLSSSSSSSYSATTKLRELLRNLKWVSTEDVRNPTSNNSKIENVQSSYGGCRTDDVFLIQYTSGSTGIPKPVRLTAGSAAHNVRAARKYYDLNPNSVIVSWLPQYHDCGLMFLSLTLVSGSTCVLTSPKSFINRPRLWLELITRYKATCSPVPSFTLPLVVKKIINEPVDYEGGASSSLDLRSMKNLIIINEPIYKAAVDEFVQVFKRFGLNGHFPISPSYGLAENCTFVSTAWRRGDAINLLPSYKKLLPSARLGKSCYYEEEEEEEDDDVDIVIVNDGTHELVEDGVEGEIWVSSPSNASGYLGHPFLTSQVFYGKLNNNLCRRSFVRTGDRGVVVKGEERYLYVTGRSSDVIKLQNGQEVHPHYIEAAAYSTCTEFLRGGCVVAFMVSSKTLCVVAELQRSFAKGGVYGGLKNVCEGIRRGVMEEEGVEVGYVCLVKAGSVPKTTSGKLQRWFAKDKLLGGKMRVIFQRKFDNFLLSKRIMLHGKDEERNNKAIEVVAKETTSFFLLSQPNAVTSHHPSLLSSL